MANRTDRNGKASLALAALGVVYGDIGTSPLYAVRESLGRGNGVAVTDANILGVLSLIVWSLTVVITIKYLLLVMRADNHGEGGILALTALILPRRKNAGRSRLAFVVIGLFGTALLYGDGMITPAISVLSAVEGVSLAAPALSGWVIPLAAVILVTLFSVQRLGTARVGAVFGPAMAVWFSVLAILGGISIAASPAVLKALSPTYAVSFFAANGLRGFLVLGSVFLVVTGGEALYADMGHFGRRPITVGWFALVLPSLILNYFGQGALLLRNPEAIENPFFLLAPNWAQWPMTILATAASVIASQALISGAFSLTVQAINLDYAPRFTVRQTSETERGQVYVPAVNWFLMVAAVGLVISFGTSSSLAAAYGVAVTMTMLITTALFFLVARVRWNWSLAKTLIVVMPLAIVDSAFLGANLFKIPQGGWFPLTIGLLIFTLMVTWRTGRIETRSRLLPKRLSLDRFVASLKNNPPKRIPGVGVYLHRRPGVVPPALLATLQSFKVLHEDVVVLNVLMSEDAHVPHARRESIRHLALNFHSIQLTYGYADDTNIPEDLLNTIDPELGFDMAHTRYFLAREELEPGFDRGLAGLRNRLFVRLHRNARNPAGAFNLPDDRTMAVGTLVSLANET